MTKAQVEKTWELRHKDERARIDEKMFELWGYIPENAEVKIWPLYPVGFEAEVLIDGFWLWVFTGIGNKIFAECEGIRR